MSKCTCVYETRKNSRAVREGYVMSGSIMKECDNCKSRKAAKSQAKSQTQASKPIAVVTGWYDGRCVIEPLDRALAIPVGMALYSQPQAQAGDGEAVAEIQEYKHWLFCDNGERDGFEWRKRQVNNGDLLSLPHGTKLYTHQQPSVNRQDLIDLLIATRTQSEGVTADLIIKMLDAQPAVNQQLLEGYALMPLEPTEAVIDAGVAVALAASVHGKGGWNNYMKALYRSFIAAAQEQGGMK